MTGGGPTGLRETMECMHALVRGELSAEEAAARLGAPVERVAIYQDFVRGHIAKALGKNYTVCRELLSDETWSALEDGYFRAQPARKIELNASAEAFRGFLGQAAAGTTDLDPAHEREIASHGLALLELAELEWLEFAVYAAQVEIPAPSTLETPAVNPSLQVLQFETPVASWLAARRRGDRSSPLPSGGPGETVFLFRGPQTSYAVFVVADDALLFAFKVVHDGLSAAQAAEVTGSAPGDVEAAIQRAAELGLVLRPNT